MRVGISLFGKTLNEDGARYAFDYSRFTAEIELIREGIKAQRSPTPATINLVQRAH